MTAELGAGGFVAVALAFKSLFADGKFKELKGKEWDEFKEKATAEQLAEYYNELNESKRKEIKTLIDSKASKEDIDSLKDELSQAINDQMKSLNETIKQYGIAIKKLSEKEKEDRASQFKSVRDGLKDNIEKLKALKGASDSGAAKNASFSIKASADMLLSTNISGGNVPVEQRLPGMNAIASRRIRLLDIISRGTAKSNLISWVYQANKDGAAGGTSEGATKNQIDFDLVVASETLKKRTCFIKLSDEMIDDVDFVNTEINNELMRELLKDIENQVYQGDGTGNNLRGIRTVATAFAAGTFAGTVDNANEVDVLTVAMDQISEANQDEATYILVRRNTLTKLKLYKVSSTDKRYIDRLIQIGDTMYLDGVPIIATNLVTADQYCIGNFNLATVYDKGEISIEVGLDGNDFTKNMRTIRAEWRGLCIVKNNDRSAFVKGVFTTDKAALETP